MMYLRNFFFMFLEKQKVSQKIRENVGDYFLEFRQNQ